MDGIGLVKGIKLPFQKFHWQIFFKPKYNQQLRWDACYITINWIDPVVRKTYSIKWSPIGYSIKLILKLNKTKTKNPNQTKTYRAIEQMKNKVTPLTAYFIPNDDRRSVMSHKLIPQKTTTTTTNTINTTIKTTSKWFQLFIMCFWSISVCYVFVFSFCFLLGFVARLTFKWWTVAINHRESEF